MIESENINEKLNNEVKQLSEERISISKSQRRSCVGETYRKRMAHQGCIYSRVKESLSYKNPLLPPILVLVIKKRLWQKRLSMNYKALSLSSYIWNFIFNGKKYHELSDGKNRTQIKSQRINFFAESPIQTEKEKFQGKIFGEVQNKVSTFLTLLVLLMGRKLMKKLIDLLVKMMWLKPYVFADTLAGICCNQPTISP